MLFAYSFPNVFDVMFEEMSGRSAAALVGLLAGALFTWSIARWKRHKDRRSILCGDARDTVVIEQHLVSTAEIPSANGSGKVKVPTTLRIRSLGQSEVPRVVPNGQLAVDLMRRAMHVTHDETLISMAGPEGSFLLETLSNFVCDRVANAPFEHRVYVLAPCCEPAGLAVHQPITILLIPADDLALFETWSNCRNVQVEHGSDGMRIVTLHRLARRFKAEHEKITTLAKEGRPTRHEETMYLLDLGLDQRTSAIPVKDVPWSRFADVLEDLHLESMPRSSPANANRAV